MTELLPISERCVTYFSPRGVAASPPPPRSARAPQERRGRHRRRRCHPSSTVALQCLSRSQECVAVAGRRASGQAVTAEEPTEAAGSFIPPPGRWRAHRGDPRVSDATRSGASIAGVR